MKAVDAQNLWTVSWNFESGYFGIQTVSDATLSGISLFEGRAGLQMLDKVSDEDRARIMHAHQWIFLGLFDSEREAHDFVLQISNSANE